MRVIQLRPPRRPITSGGITSRFERSDRESNANAPNATSPVPGRRTGSSVAAFEVTQRHASACPGIAPAVTGASSAVPPRVIAMTGLPTPTIPSDRRSHASGSSGSA